MEGLQERVGKLEQGRDLPLLKRHSTSSPERVLDIGIVFSDPLVTNSQSEQRELIEPVSYKEEIRRLRDKFRNYALVLKVEVATIDNFIKIVDRNPKILHIICHGQRSESGVSLCFESSEYLGELKLLQRAFFHEQVRLQKNIAIQVLFINACHSEDVARVFLENTSIPFAIAVESQEKVNDEAAVIFSCNFY
jgi:hypothetical protein